MRVRPLIRKAIIAAMVVCSLAAYSLRAADYHVGDGQPYANIGAVAWHTLVPGDTVWIHWRATPYREKWVIGRQGTPAAPISVRGVPGPAGQLPVIDGQNATTPAPLNYWNENRSVIKIGGSNTPNNTIAKWIVVEGLDIRGARPPNTFTNDSGAVETYGLNAAAIHVGLGEDIIIRGCILRDCGNGLFVTSFGSDISRGITIEGNHIHSNGNSGSLFEHNTYTAAIGILYQYNRFGPLLSGASGNNLKDRSAGLVVRHNWIEGGNRQLDLVDAEDSTLIRDDPAYHKTDVYGNVLIEPAGAGNRQILHYGGDSGTEPDYRKGTLYFYHNTMVSTRTDRTTLMRLSTNSENCDARNNILYVTTAGTELEMIDDTGVLNLSHNWIKPGWLDSFFGGSGTVNDDGTSIETASPGFVNVAGQDFSLAAGSPCVEAATALHPTVLPDGAVTRQYVKHQSSEPRMVVGGASDVGAFELQPAACDGDLDCDGDRDMADVPAFVLALVDENGFTATYAGCPISAADLNGDSIWDGRDVADFVTLLLLGACP